MIRLLEKWCIMRWLVREFRTPSNLLPDHVEQGTREVMDQLKEVSHVQIRNEEAVNNLLASLLRDVSGHPSRKNSNEENTDAG